MGKKEESGGALYPLENGYHAFSESNCWVEVTNGNHVSLRTPAYNGRYMNITNVSSNGTNARSTNNEKHATIFTLPAGSEVVLTISNRTQTDTYAHTVSINAPDSTTDIATTGALASQTTKTITFTPETDTPVGSISTTITSRNQIQFDISLTVDGVRWI